MLEFRRATAGLGLVNWQVIDNTVISFGRGDLGHIALNPTTETATARLQTDLPPGEYAGLVNGAPVRVDDDGHARVTLEPLSFVAILATDL